MMTLQNTTKYTLVSQVESYVHCYFSEHPNHQLVYHNREHTIAVVQTTTELAEYICLLPGQRVVLQVAAWFHDLGYLVDYYNHEVESARLAKQFLSDRSVDKEFVAQVTRAIMATCFSNKPEGEVEEILCDADTAHLSSDTYTKDAELLRQERNNFLEKTKKKSWRKANLKFMQQHRYYTEYARQYWQPLKERQHQKLEKQTEIKIGKDQTGAMNKLHRGAETLFRSTLRNHMELSSIADSKANIMISVNSILLSVLITVIYRKIALYPDLFVPTVILTCVNLLTIVFAILATLPQVTSGVFKKEDLLANRANPLFFGNFFRMSIQDYEWAIQETIKNPKLTYGSMSRDLFHLGVVLAKKYRRLRISYLTFMIGLAIAMVAYMITGFRSADFSLLNIFQ